MVSSGESKREKREGKRDKLSILGLTKSEFGKILWLSFGLFKEESLVKNNSQGIQKDIISIREQEP